MNAMKITPMPTGMPQVVTVLADSGMPRIFGSKAINRMNAVGAEHDGRQQPAKRPRLATSSWKRGLA